MRDWTSLHRFFMIVHARSDSGPQSKRSEANKNDNLQIFKVFMIDAILLWTRQPIFHEIPLTFWGLIPTERNHFNSFFANFLRSHPLHLLHPSRKSIEWSKESNWKSHSHLGLSVTQGKYFYSSPEPSGEAPGSKIHSRAKYYLSGNGFLAQLGVIRRKRHPVYQ